MNIGDRVRLLHGKEEGVVKRFTDNRFVEVEIEDGFVIPVLRSELVVVSKEETSRFNLVREEAAGEKQDNKVIATQGIFLAFTEDGNNEVLLQFINNTDFDVSYSISEVQKNNHFGIFHHIAPAKTSDKIRHYSIGNLEKWPAFLIQALFYKKSNYSPLPALLKKINFKASTFFKHKKENAPLIKKTAYLFQLDEEQSDLKPETILSALEENSGKTQKLELVITKPDREIDLHIEKLVKDHSKMSNSEMLSIQLKTFEKNLENAIASGMKEIIFIHGIGNGVLKEAIHKVLGKHQEVSYFQDSHKEKFGYGATKVSLK